MKTPKNTIVPATKMEGIVTVETDIAVKLSLNEILEIIVEEKNAERQVYRQEVGDFLKQCHATLRENTILAFKENFSKELEGLTKLFGEPKYVFHSTIVNCVWENCHFIPFKPQHCGTIPRNVSDAQQELCNLSGVSINELTAQNNSLIINGGIGYFQQPYHYNQVQNGYGFLLHDINLKQVRITINKELVSKKSMTNQEIYDRVNELIVIPENITSKVDGYKKIISDYYNQTPKQIIKFWKETKQI